MIENSLAATARIELAGSLALTPFQDARIPYAFVAKLCPLGFQLFTSRGSSTNAGPDVPGQEHIGNPRAASTGIEPAESLALTV